MSCIAIIYYYQLRNDVDLNENGIGFGILKLRYSYFDYWSMQLVWGYRIIHEWSFLRYNLCIDDYKMYFSMYNNPAILMIFLYSQYLLHLLVDYYTLDNFKIGRYIYSEHFNTNYNFFSDKSKQIYHVCHRCVCSQIMSKSLLVQNVPKRAKEC